VFSFLTVGALKLPDRPMAAFNISSRFSSSGAKDNCFFPLAMVTFSLSEIIFQAAASSILVFLASSFWSMARLFSAKTFCAFLQETHPFLKYAQSIVILYFLFQTLIVYLIN
jgi:hypothetical protein